MIPIFLKAINIDKEMLSHHHSIPMDLIAWQGLRVCRNLGKVCKNITKKKLLQYLGDTGNSSFKYSNIIPDLIKQGYQHNSFTKQQILFLTPLSTSFTECDYSVFFILVGMISL